MSIDKCVARIRKAVGEDVLTDAQAKKIIGELSRERISQRKTGLDSADEKFLKKVEQMIEEEKTASVIEKRNYLINKMREQDFEGFRANFKDDYEAYQAFLAGINASEKSGRSSIASRIQALNSEYLRAGLLTELEREKLLPFFTDRKYGKDIVIEMYELDATNGNPGRTGNTEAVKIAKIVKRIQDDLVNRQNAAGAWIKKLPGYITRQSHDQTKLRKSSFEEWRDFILPKLDTDRTFEWLPQDKWEESLKESFLGLTTGDHTRPQGSRESDGLVAFRGPGSVGRKVSEHRSLHFKDAESWYEYNEKFGSGSAQASIIQGIDRATRNLGLMEKAGPNPVNFVQTIQDKLVRNNRENPKMVDKLLGKDTLHQLRGDTPQNLMKELMGETNFSQSLNLANISSGFRQYANIVRLGESVLSQFPDIAAKAATLRLNGANPLKGYQTGLTDLLYAFEGEDRKILAKSLGAGFEGVLHSSIGRMMIDDQGPGVMTNLSNLFFKLNFMEYWNDAQKAGMSRTLSSILASNSEKTFANMNPRTAESLSLYGIGEREWDVIRQAKKKVGDHEFIVPELIEDQAIRTQLFEYITDQVDYGILTPGVREKAIINKGTQTGTLMGEALRFMGQFKTFSVAGVSKLMPRELQTSGNLSSKIAGTAHIMIGSTILGYASMVAKDVLHGKEPRDIDDPKTWQAAMLQGGGLGIYGDFLFGEADRYGQGLWGTLAGPVPGQVDAMYQMFQKAKKGINEKTGEPYLKGADIFRFAKNNTPFINLFYVRSALDYMFLYGVQEELSPGYLQNMERRLRDEQDQEFYLPPTQYANQF